MSEIASRSNEPATNLSRPIKKLIDLGFLSKDIPFDADEEKSLSSEILERQFVDILAFILMLEQELN